MNVKNEICKSFNNHAKCYEQSAKIQHEIGLRLLEKLDYLKINPIYILDLGCGSGLFTIKLKKLYPKATIIGFDLAIDMLKEAREKQGLLKKWPLVGGDMLTLPFASGIFDLVFSNQVIHWSESIKDLLGELSRVLSKDGCLLFSTLGPDTFVELRQSWATIDNYAHVNDYIDMHDLGDYLLSLKFIDPVIEMEIITAHFSSLAKLLDSLKAQGVRNINLARNHGLTGKGSWRNFERAMEAFSLENGDIPLTYEVVYGLAWKGATRAAEKGVETMISVNDLLKTYNLSKLS